MSLLLSRLFELTLFSALVNFFAGCHDITTIASRFHGADEITKFGLIIAAFIVGRAALHLLRAACRFLRFGVLFRAVARLARRLLPSSCEKSSGKENPPEPVGGGLEAEGSPVSKKNFEDR